MYEILLPTFKVGYLLKYTIYSCFDECQNVLAYFLNKSQSAKRLITYFKSNQPTLKVGNQN